MDVKNRNCCICGISATNYHMSIIGQIPFFVCNEHYENATPYYGLVGQMFKGATMGLIDKKTNDILPMLVK